jgi:uncharacterized protein (DUF58 family)
MTDEKLEFTSSGGKAKPSPGESVTAIVKVRRGDYVPKGVTLRARIDATMFTASFDAGLLPQLEADPEVESIALSKPLRSST